jgi:DNA-directed RNA polymerase subunit RPC12/RpoP
MMAATDTSPALTWRVVDGGAYELAGEIDEHVDFSPLLAKLSGHAVFDLARVRRINSQGVRAWIDFLRDVPVRTLVFRRCSPAVITQVNMIANFRGPATIESFLAPYVCDACGEEAEHLIDVAEQRRRGGAVPAVACPKCGAAMQFDDVPDRYFSFLVE